MQDECTGKWEGGLHVPKYGSVGDCPTYANGFQLDREIVSDETTWVIEINRAHPKYKYHREILLHAIGDYGWYYGVPHAIFSETKCPERLQRIGHTLHNWGCAWPFNWNRIGRWLREWGGLLTRIIRDPIEIKRGRVFHDLEITPYGPGSGTMIRYDQMKTRHDIYQGGFDSISLRLSDDQLNGVVFDLAPGQATGVLLDIRAVRKGLRRLHGQHS